MPDTRLHFPSNTVQTSQASIAKYTVEKTYYVLDIGFIKSYELGQEDR